MMGGASPGRFGMLFDEVIIYRFRISIFYADTVAWRDA